ncbi:pimeloyl-ACP methyl ester carboxylesterase [Tamaricihabitans halophyticus]|uniref:Pimeloyl-ACP methyl ester carboxylesterase n=1 Tax=Tamaricihabitans halophyticus TaxID=1262583 RepID=A0A4R2Q970_9PSEU|nr:alpha/beta fold hydrolase [Tamaricihabitans halophyticus]TCP45440.1 pimeloyl-ACP methyl ester carboxylesterase [Tamaricihabitans halophyticus]
MRVAHFTSVEGRSRFRAAYDRAMDALPVPALTQDVDTPFGSVRMLRFERAGKSTVGGSGAAGGEPFVLLPGKAAPAAMWAPNLAALTAERTVYAIDLLGEPGMSVQSVPIRRTADQVSWLRAALASIEADRVHLVGHSIGGWHALTFAAHAPEHLASVAILDPANTLDRIPMSTVVRSIGATSIAPAWLRRRFFASLADDTEVDTQDPIVDLLDIAMRCHSSALPLPERPKPAMLRSVRVPALVVLGGRSTMLDPERARAVAEAQLPDARVEVWSDASHALPGEHPERTAARLLEFAREARR